MLSEADRDLISRDVALPGLRRLLDSAEIQQELETGPSQVTLRYLRYKPQTNCLAAFDTSTERIYGKVRSDRSGVELHCFPKDSRLKTLSMLANDEYRAGFLSRHRPLEHIPQDAILTTLNYKPERRYVGALIKNGQPVAALKIYPESVFPHVARIAKTIRSAGPYRVPKCLRASARRRALVFDWCEGALLSNHVAMGRVPTGGIEAVAHALRHLHAQRLDLPPDAQHSFAEQILSHSRTISWLLPRAASLATRLAQHLVQRLSEIPPRLASLHGDFYAKQILLDEGGVTFLDFDEALMGHPLLDVGNFLAHLEADVVRGRLPAEAAGSIGENFASAYSARDIDIFTAASLFAHTPHFFRSREAAWDQKIEQVLARVQVLSRLPAADVFDPGIPQLALATSHSTIEQHLGRLVGEITVLRHKPGRRCLIQYTFSDGRAPEQILGKVTARKSKDIAMVAGAKLRGLGICVPEPLGDIPRAHLQLQEKVAGNPATGPLLSPQNAELAKRCARLIDGVHKSGITVEREHTIADELDLLADRFNRVASRQPHLGKRLGDVLTACRSASLLAAKPKLIHRDFYPDQVLIDGDRLWLVDLDLCAMGDPCLDHGNFLAHLLELSLRKHGSTEALAATQQAYIDEALALAGHDARPRIEHFTTLSLARHIFISTQFPDRHHLTETLLANCEERLDSNRIFV